MAISIIPGCANNQRAEKFDRFQDLISNTSPEQRAEKQTRILVNRLNLSNAQLGVVEEINLEFSEELQALVSSNASRRGKARQIKSLVERRNDAMQEILSEDQFRQYLNIQAALRQRINSNF